MLQRRRAAAGWSARPTSARSAGSGSNTTTSSAATRRRARARDAAVVRVEDGPKGLALTCDVTPRYCAADPVEGGKQAVAEAWRNLTAVGALPLALTDNLNFGNPEKPEAMGELVGCIHGHRRGRPGAGLPDRVGQRLALQRDRRRAASCRPRPSAASAWSTTWRASPARPSRREGDASPCRRDARLARPVAYLRDLRPRRGRAAARRPRGGAAQRRLRSRADPAGAAHDRSTTCRTAASPWPRRDDAGPASAPVEPWPRCRGLPPHAFLFGEDQARYLVSGRARRRRTSSQTLGRQACRWQDRHDGRRPLTLPGRGAHMVDELTAAHESWCPRYMARRAPAAIDATMAMDAAEIERMIREALPDARSRSATSPATATTTPPPSCRPPSRARPGSRSTRSSTARSRAAWAGCCTPLRCRPRRSSSPSMTGSSTVRRCRADRVAQCTIMICTTALRQRSHGWAPTCRSTCPRRFDCSKQSKPGYPRVRWIRLAEASAPSRATSSAHHCRLFASGPLSLLETCTDTSGSSGAKADRFLHLHQRTCSKVRYMLDTNVVSDIIRRPRGIAAERAKAEGDAILHAASSLLHESALWMRHRRGRSLPHPDSAPRLPFTRRGASVRRASRWWVRRDSGQIWRRPSRLSGAERSADRGACWRASGAAIVTANEDEFRRVEGLQVEQLAPGLSRSLAFIPYILDRAGALTSALQRNSIWPAYTNRSTPR